MQVGLCWLDPESLPREWGFPPGSLPPLGASPDGMLTHKGMSYPDAASQQAVEAVAPQQVLSQQPDATGATTQQAAAMMSHPAGESIAEIEQLLQRLEGGAGAGGVSSAQGESAISAAPAKSQPRKDDDPHANIGTTSSHTSTQASAFQRMQTDAGREMCSTAASQPQIPSTNDSSTVRFRGTYVMHAHGSIGGSAASAAESAAAGSAADRNAAPAARPSGLGVSLPSAMHEQQSQVSCC